MKWWWISILLLISMGLRSQTISTFAGGGTVIGDGGHATAAIVLAPNGVAFDRHGNFYVAENNGNRLRKIDTTGIITTLAGNGSGGFSGDGGSATAALLHSPTSVILDTFGNLYIDDENNNRIRKIDITTGTISTICGNGTGSFYGDGGPATAAEIWNPDDICFDKFGNLYIADYLNYRVRKINTSGIISTFAGSGGFSAYGTGDGGPATAATFNLLTGIIADDTGNIYICDYNAGKVRKVDTTGIITTIAGNGTYTYSGDGIAATAAQIAPGRLGFDDSENLFIADKYNLRVYKIDHSGILHCVAGNGTTTFSGDGGPATAASIYFPFGLSFDPCNNLYISDVSHGRVRKVTYSTTSLISVTSITATPGDTVCSGASVSYHCTTTSTGSSVTYQWSVNGTIVSTAGSTYSYTPVNGDSVRCAVITSSPCSGTSTAHSNTIYMVVNPSVTTTIGISASPGDTVCSGTSVTYTSSITGGTSPSYQWKKNGANVATTSSYTYTPSNGDSIRCVLTSSATCASTTSLSSSTISMVVNPAIVPTISISASTGDTVCTGTTVTYLATISGGGSAPAYHWIKNGVSVSASSSYSYTPSNGDSIRCILISNAPCAAPDTISSATIHMVVNTTVTPTISISVSPGDTVCSGTSVIFSSSITGGGSSPSYQWKKNGVNVGTGSSYTYTPSDGDSVRCVLTSSASCAVSTAVSSSMIHMVVHPTVVPTITISASPNDTVCSGTIVTYTATITGSGSAPSYKWIKNGVTSGTGSSYTYTPSNGDSVRCVLSSNAPCASPTSLSSNMINMVVDSVLSPSITITGPYFALIGSVVTMTATVAGAGGSYYIEWMDYGTIFATTTVPTVSYTKAMPVDDITATVVTTSGACIDSALSPLFEVKEGPTGINMLPKGSEVHIYPNPANNLIYIDNISGNAAYQLLNSISIEVQKGDLLQKDNRLDIESLPIGMYIIIISMENDGERIVRKVVKE